MTKKSIGWKFDNTYQKLPNIMLSKIEPEKIAEPKLIIKNDDVSELLGLNFIGFNDNELALLFSGNNLPEGTETIAQAYAGHQFGHFNILGDGRALILGEHITPKNKRYDLQFKGSGKTPYSRNGDGKAALGPMLREYIISEAMFRLNIPTSRSLAVVITGEKIIREKELPGAILTEGRGVIEQETQQIIQDILDEYQSGIQVTQVQTQKADPPDQVIDAFRDVQAARADMERSKNEAEAYANDVIPRARGEAAKILQAAEAYKKEVVAKAEGEASRFLAIYNEYKNAKQVTQERMYLETMEKVLADIDKVIIDKNSGSGVVPYLPLPEIRKKTQ